MRNSARGRTSTWQIKRTTSGTLWLTGRSCGRLHVCGWIHCRSVKPTTLRPGSSNTGSSLRRASWMQTFAHIAWPRTPTFGMTSCGLPGHQWSRRWHSAWQGTWTTKPRQRPRQHWQQTCTTSKSNSRPRLLASKSFKQLKQHGSPRPALHGAPLSIPNTRPPHGNKRGGQQALPVRWFQQSPRCSTICHNIITKGG